ncbi:hypothetical protein E2320_007887 [Naja naja]|nr:hypothetical protein E2320_007887 [Naja naja]
MRRRKNEEGRKGRKEGEKEGDGDEGREEGRQEGRMREERKEGEKEGWIMGGRRWVEGREEVEGERRKEPLPQGLEVTQVGKGGVRTLQFGKEPAPPSLKYGTEGKGRHLREGGASVLQVSQLVEEEDGGGGELSNLPLRNPFLASAGLHFPSGLFFLQSSVTPPCPPSPKLPNFPPDFTSPGSLPSLSPPFPSLLPKFLKVCLSVGTVGCVCVFVCQVTCQLNFDACAMQRVPSRIPHRKSSLSFYFILFYFYYFLILDVSEKSFPKQKGRESANRIWVGFDVAEDELAAQTPLGLNGDHRGEGWEGEEVEKEKEKEKRREGEEKKGEGKKEEEKGGGKERRKKKGWEGKERRGGREEGEKKEKEGSEGREERRRGREGKRKRMGRPGERRKGRKDGKERRREEEEGEKEKVKEGWEGEEKGGKKEEKEKERISRRGEERRRGTEGKREKEERWEGKEEEKEGERKDGKERRRKEGEEEESVAGKHRAVLSSWKNLPSVAPVSRKLSSPKLAVARLRLHLPPSWGSRCHPPPPPPSLPPGVAFTVGRSLDVNSKRKEEEEEGRGRGREKEREKERGGVGEGERERETETDKLWSPDNYVSCSFCISIELFRVSLGRRKYLLAPSEEGGCLGVVERA